MDPDPTCCFNTAIKNIRDRKFAVAHVANAGTSLQWILFLLSTLVLSCVGGKNDLPDAARSFISCVNKGFQVRPATWTELLKEFAPARVYIEGVWWSDTPSRVPVTVVTQLSANRLNQLEAQCHAWNGPLSAVVYQPLLQKAAANTTLGLAPQNMLRLQQIRQAVEAAYGRSEVNPTGCQLSVMLLWEVVADKYVHSLYPYNVGRNYALLQARTDLVALIDVDLVLSSALAKDLRNKSRAQALMAEFQRPVAMVLPAFEPSRRNLKIGRQVASFASRCDKTTLKVLWDKRVVRQFNLYHFPGGHAPTNYKHWFWSTAPYPVKFREKYEPWVMMNRTSVPWYDVRLRGFGGDKLLHLLHVNATGISFKVYPNAWIVHRPHGFSPGKKAYLQDVSNMRQDDATHDALLLPQANNKVFTNATRDLAIGAFRPVVDQPLIACVDQLPWWRGFVPQAHSL